jgi:hypothetical protein
MPEAALRKPQPVTRNPERRPAVAYFPIAFETNKSYNKL